MIWLGIDVDFEYKTGMVFILREYMNVGYQTPVATPYTLNIPCECLLCSSARRFSVETSFVFANALFFFNFASVWIVDEILELFRQCVNFFFFFQCMLCPILDLSWFWDQQFQYYYRGYELVILSFFRISEIKVHSDA
jgi:hypothetical protein